MSKPLQQNKALSPADFSDAAASKAASRRRDAEDIATGRRTAEEVQKENSWLIPDPTAAVILNEHEACAAL